MGCARVIVTPPKNDKLTFFLLKPVCSYCPSVFILKEGQHVLINKGRLHAFRKMTLDPLPEKDCHARLRLSLIQEMNITRAPLCISVAFDW